jgi:hypothetical protein
MTTVMRTAQGAKQKKTNKTQQNALLTDDVAVDANSVGDRWTVQDLDRLANLIALIAMGQALHAAKIIEDLSPTSSAITAASLTEAAKKQLRISGTTNNTKMRPGGVGMDSSSRQSHG